MRVLFLSPWFPYPLSQGSQIRAYHLIKALASQHEVALVSFADSNPQPSAVSHMREICTKVEVITRSAFEHDRVKTGLGWFSRTPSAVVSSYSQAMADKVAEVTNVWKPDAVFAFTFVAIPYALQVSEALKVVDVDNLMERMLYEDYLNAANPLKRARKMVAWKKMRGYEKKQYAKFDLCLVLTEGDRRKLLDFVPIPPERVGVVPNGVDISFNCPDSMKPAPGQLVYHGALTYLPNYDAMEYFLREIFPLITQEIPEPHIFITGRADPLLISKLPSDDRITMTGYLEDIRPVVKSSWASVVPLRIGGGTRIKILEAMALGTPVVSTSKGAEGLEVEHNKHLLIADTPGEFAAQTIRLLQSTELRETLKTNALQIVHERYAWGRIGEELNRYLSIFSSS